MTDYCIEIPSQYLKKKNIEKSEKKYTTLTRKRLYLYIYKRGY